MVTRQKLELEINTPVQVELLYNEPVIGQSNYGNYYLFAIKSDGKEFSYFAPEAVYEELKNLKAGDIAVITKLAAQRGNKLITKYVVDRIKETSIDVKPTTEIPQAEESVKHENQPQADKFYDLMLCSYKDAFQIQTDLNGMVDIEKIAITLFIARSNKR